MYAQRKDAYAELEEQRQSKVLVYVTGDRPGMETKISPEVLDFFVRHLDAMGETDKITLVLYTRGGDTLASWSIANLIRQFCTDFEVIVPFKAHSGGTLISLGADRIVMTKQATLGPIDPSVNMALNPGVPGAPPNAPKVPVSVEAISGYIDFAKSEVGAGEDPSLVLQLLAANIHPLVLGQVYRSRTQIRMLASRLLEHQVGDDSDKKGRILDFLCSESGSHDYPIYRQEARDFLGLNIERPDDEGYALIRRIYNDFTEDLELTGSRFDPNVLLAGQASQAYSCRRALIESIAGGSDAFTSAGTITKVQVMGPTGPLDGVQDARTFEGWKHES